MKKLFLIINVAVFFLISNIFTNCYASDNDVIDNKTIIVRGGELKVVDGNESTEPHLLLNNKKLYDNTDFIDRLSFIGHLSIEKKYSIGNQDIVLMMNNSGGTGCPVLYFFVAITSQSDAQLSPEFGTCSDLPELTQKGSKIIINMPEITGIGKMVKYVYKNNIIFENGKRIKSKIESPQELEDGGVVINGYGRVLVSEGYDKKMYKCVASRVRKEKKFNDGWNEKIIAECNQLRMK